MFNKVKARFFNHVDSDDTVIMVAGGSAAVSGAVIGTAIKVSGVALSTPVVVSTVGAAPITLSVATFWGGALVGAKVSCALGVGFFMYGFINGVRKSIKEGK